jgi:3-oxoacyl-[acyl-carrier-protein] synthase-1
MIELAVQACGMVTAVGLTAPAACAAIRCGLDNPAETSFMDNRGRWITGCEVPLEQPWRGRAKLAHMAATAIGECIQVQGLAPNTIKDIPLILCLAETDRPGRIQGQEEHLLSDIAELLDMTLNPASRVISQGRVGGVQAVRTSHDLLSGGSHRLCLVAGADTLLTAGTLAAYDRDGRILTEDNSDGFIPGEAGAAVLLTPANRADNPPLVIKGIGFGTEAARMDSGQPLRADGMVAAVKSALADAEMDLAEIDCRLCDLNGEQYGFKEAALTLTRILRKRKEEFDIWHPAECIGETGTAIVPILLAVASAAMSKDYAPGPAMLCHCANDDGQRAAMIVSRTNPRRT